MFWKNLWTTFLHAAHPANLLGFMVVNWPLRHAKASFFDIAGGYLRGYSCKKTWNMPMVVMSCANQIKDLFSPRDVTVHCLDQQTKSNIGELPSLDLCPSFFCCKKNGFLCNYAIYGGSCVGSASPSSGFLSQLFGKIGDSSVNTIVEVSFRRGILIILRLPESKEFHSPNFKHILNSPNYVEFPKP